MSVAAAQSGQPAASEGQVDPTADNHTALPQSGFLTAERVRRRYDISNSTLYSWIAKGLLPAPVKIGPRASRFRAEDLRAFEASLKDAGK